MKTGETFACNKPGVFNSRPHSGPFHMSPVAGLARLAGRIFAFCSYGKFSPVTVHMENFSLVTEMNKARPFKLHPGNRAGVFIWENF